MAETEKQYLMSRGLMPSVRLLAQHWLWKELFGWNLHPAAKAKWAADKERNGEETPRSIADVATGNAIWLVEESVGLPPGSQAIGFDISGSMAPSAQTLPENVSIQILDATADVPAEYCNVFDVVHVRLVVAAVQGNDPRPILRNMIRMLKPGGMLQWGEIVLDDYFLGKPPGESKTAVRSIMREVAKHVGTGRITPDTSWIKNLPAIFEECGLKSVECTRGGEPRKELWRYWAEIVSGAVAEIVSGTGIGSEYLPDLVKDVDRGDYVYVEPRIVTGWKTD